MDTFLQGRILPPLIRFSIPLIFSLVLQALYGGVDLAVVGQFAQTASVSAVATGSQVMQAATVLVTGLTMGVTVLLGQAIGAQGRPDGRRRSGRADSPVFRAGRGVDRGHDPLCTAGGKAYECAGGRV